MAASKRREKASSMFLLRLVFILIRQAKYRFWACPLKAESKLNIRGSISLLSLQGVGPLRLLSYGKRTDPLKCPLGICRPSRGVGGLARMGIAVYLLRFFKVINKNLWENGSLPFELVELSCLRALQRPADNLHGNPFYPLGKIGVPFSAGYYSQSVKGIWQDPKVFENSDIDTLLSFSQLME